MHGQQNIYKENELRNVCEFEIRSTKVSEILILEVQC